MRREEYHYIPCWENEKFSTLALVCVVEIHEPVRTHSGIFSLIKPTIVYHQQCSCFALGEFHVRIHWSTDTITIVYLDLTRSTISFAAYHTCTVTPAAGEARLT